MVRIQLPENLVWNKEAKRSVIVLSYVYEGNGQFVSPETRTVAQGR